MAVAVLVVNYLAYDRLDDSLASLEPHLGADDEVTVVDMASVPDRLEPLRARHARVCFVPVSDNRGFAAGVNLAARHSAASNLLLLNPDTLVLGPIVRALEQRLLDHPDTGVVGPRVVEEDGTVQPSARRFPGPSAVLGGRSTWLTARFPDNWASRRNLVGRTATAPIDVDWVSGSCFMTPRKVFEELDGLDEQFFLYWEDADYCRRVTNRGLRCTYLPSVAVQHAGGQSAKLVPELAVRAFHRSAFRLYCKHGGLLARACAPAVAAALWARGQWRLRGAVASRVVSAVPLSVAPPEPDQ